MTATIRYDKLLKLPMPAVVLHNLEEALKWIHDPAKYTGLIQGLLRKRSRCALTEDDL